MPWVPFYSDLCTRIYVETMWYKRHEGPCSKPRQCLNCKGPHDSENVFCPARNMSGVIKWVNSFILDRTAKIRLDGTTSNIFQIQSGLPQGSPASPILFLLYMEPVLRLSRGRFGYADDILTLETAKTLEECGQKLQASLNQTLQWGYENGVQFESTKTELQYFHNKRKYTESPLMTENTLIQANDSTR
ncbi:hypothetical protein EPUL_006801, partial [Erysiphe pulchra]